MMINQKIKDIIDTKEKVLRDELKQLKKLHNVYLEKIRYIVKNIEVVEKELRRMHNSSIEQNLRR